MKRSPKVKLIDVARAANVSAATVSRLVNGQAGLDPQTRDRVVKAAVRLGFDLERGKKSKIIAFLLSNRGVLHPFHSSVLMGVEAYCAEHNYALLFLPFQYATNAPAEDLKLPEILQRSRMISGVIAAGTNSQNLLGLLTRRGIPWVGLGNNVIGEVPKAQTGLVYFDDLTGAYELTRYLLSLRHRQIAFIGNLHLPWYARRHDGYRRAMLEAGLTCQVSELNSREGEEMGYLAAKLLFQQSVMPTAIFAGDDAAARGVYKAARDIGIPIPDQLSVVGFNDTPEAPALQPPLTSVRVFTDELGKQLAESLLTRISRPDLPLRDMTLPTQLVRRESCTALPPNGLPPSRVNGDAISSGK